MTNYQSPIRVPYGHIILLNAGLSIRLKGFTSEVSHDPKRWPVYFLINHIPSLNMYYMIFNISLATATLATFFP